MKPEYKELLGQLERDLAAAGKYECMLVAVRRCEALASKPQVRLSEEELCRLWNNTSGFRVHGARLANIQEAILAAQPNASAPAPVDVPFKFEDWQQGGWIVLDRAGREVQINCTSEVYRMRRK